VHVSCLPPAFDDACYAVLGFGQHGVAAAKAAGEECWTLRCRQGGEPPPEFGPCTGPAAARLVLASPWSFSLLCCDLADGPAVMQANAEAEELARRGHMAVLLAAGSCATPLMALTHASGNQRQPARIFVAAPDRHLDLATALGTTAAGLLSSVACRSFIGVDAGDIWSAIGGNGVGMAVQASTAFERVPPWEWRAQHRR
jgi:hypothetical protein